MTPVVGISGSEQREFWAAPSVAMVGAARLSDLLLLSAAFRSFFLFLFDQTTSVMLVLFLFTSGHRSS